MSEDKITLTANEFGTPILDLTKSGLSLNDCDTLHRWQMGLQGRAESRERERIIKLLEARILAGPQPTDLIGSVSYAGHNQLLRNCIALIKGENK